MDTSRIALDHQKAALDEIISRARAFYTGHWRGLPISARWHSLMCGGTGTGKTAVAHMAASAVGAEMLRISAPGWMPSGANHRGTKETITVIAEHVCRNEKTFLVIDEIDKLISGAGGTGAGPQSESWQSYIRGEIFDLTDGRWPTGIRVPEDDEYNEISITTLTEKLSETVFVLGIGTFQEWFDTTASRRPMGFGTELNPIQDTVITSEDVCARLPRELANRFNSDLIRIPELRPEDYRKIARDAEMKLPPNLQISFREEVNRRISSAITTKKGVRFLEECLMAVLKQMPADSSPVLG